MTTTIGLIALAGTLSSLFYTFVFIKAWQTVSGRNFLGDYSRPVLVGLGVPTGLFWLTVCSRTLLPGDALHAIGPMFALAVVVPVVGMAAPTLLFAELISLLERKNHISQQIILTASFYITPSSFLLLLAALWFTIPYHLR